MVETQRRGFASPVYGPVQSRRLGRSLGIDLLPPEKTCTFNCVYCQCGRTLNLVSSSEQCRGWDTPQRVAEAVEAALASLERERVEDICFSGNGEPTLHPGLEEIALETRRIRDRHLPGVPVTLLTNSSLIGVPRVRGALPLFDRVIAKLDTAEQDVFKGVNRPAEGVASVERVVENMVEASAELGRRLVVQTLVIGSSKPGLATNDDEGSLSALASAVRLIEPQEVQLYTIARAPAEPHVIPVDKPTLERMMRVMNEMLGKSIARVYT